MTFGSWLLGFSGTETEAIDDEQWEEGEPRILWNFGYKNICKKKCCYKCCEVNKIICLLQVGPTEISEKIKDAVYLLLNQNNSNICTLHSFSFWWPSLLPLWYSSELSYRVVGGRKGKGERGLPPTLTYYFHSSIPQIPLTTNTL